MFAILLTGTLTKEISWFGTSRISTTCHCLSSHSLSAISSGSSPTCVCHRPYSGSGSGSTHLATSRRRSQQRVRHTPGERQREERMATNVMLPGEPLVIYTVSSGGQGGLCLAPSTPVLPVNLASLGAVSYQHLYLLNVL